MQRARFISDQTIISLVLIALVGWSYLAFRPAPIGLPSGDQWRFLDERPLCASNLDFVLKSLSLARTRLLGASDFLLFRPAMTGLLALQDICFRDRLAVIGALSILWHALACFSLFLLLSLHLKKLPAFLLSLVFATQYAGKDMVVFRHISPYIFALFFFTLGIWMILRERPVSSDRRRDSIAILSLFFVATLFHELIASFLLGYGGVILIVSYFAEKRRVGHWMLREVAGLFLAPALAYFVWDVVDWLAHAPQSALLYQGLRTSASWQTQIKNLLQIGGFFFTGFFLPWTIRFTPIHPLGKPRWDYPPGHETLFQVEGFVLLFFVAAVAGASAWKWAKQEDRHSFLQNLLSVFYLFFAFFFSVGRLGVDGFDYFIFGVYYFYFSNFALTALIGVSLSTQLRTSRRPAVLFTALAAAYVAGNYLLLERSLTPRTAYAKVVAEAVSGIASAMEKKTANCYGGAMTPVLAEAAPFKLLFYQSCLIRPGTPLYGVETQPGAFALASVQPPVTPPTSRTLSARDFGVAVTVAEGVTRTLSNESVPIAESGIDFPPDFQGTWITGFRDERNFVMVMLTGHVIEIRRFVEGIPTDLVVRENTPITRPPARVVSLDFRTMPDAKALALFEGPTLLQYLPGLVGETGRVGFTTLSNARVKQSLPVIRVRGRESLLKTVPAVRLELPRLSALVPPK